MLGKKREERRVPWALSKLRDADGGKVGEEKEERRLPWAFSKLRDAENGKVGEEGRTARSLGVGVNDLLAVRS